ncbi:single-stranded DNA-binding protein [Spiroplasma platyhelix]|uniref:Single-stranded DNA-binding protein n=1 Tax=Spiroplasma platyhelix PALS-1 TaxID=1276218 RepID=A0A846TSP3_9MOLU|nr:single-stranded DNA-binding protein [Spiroplasma platyhelix]MBE4704154.1 Single-stranded DNA-binding protein [Spiroplasma platyhelix PALS-1]NKE38525.1 single-stranded DNA-binding protein [Spiroplasma platyhelix PALS-1]UJB29412.1 single-strand DNA-binding protein [Spiroplasma platyhelix PALS-1]
MNHVTLIGRITRNLELRKTSTGKNYVFFSVAVDDSSNRTNFINCIAWNRVAENMTKFVGKGSLIAVAGHITTRKDNRDQYITEVSAHSVSFLDSRRRDIINDSVSSNANGSEFQKNNIEKTNEVNIDEAIKNTESYDTEISFVNNSSLDSSDSDDEAIIWD